MIGIDKRLLVALDGFALVDIIAVDDDWVDDFGNIQAVIDNAIDGDEILVMPSTCSGTKRGIARLGAVRVWLHNNGVPR